MPRSKPTKRGKSARQRAASKRAPGERPSTARDSAKTSDAGVRGDGSVVILSIKPPFAEAILDGRKRVELRKMFDPSHEGAALALYTSSPVKAILGTARVVRVHQAAPANLWRRFGSDSGVSRAVFFDYFGVVAGGSAIELDQVLRFKRAVPLAALRKLPGGFVVHPSHSVVPARSPLGELLLGCVANRGKPTEAIVRLLGPPPPALFDRDSAIDPERARPTRRPSRPRPTGAR